MLRRQSLLPEYCLLGHGVIASDFYFESPFSDAAPLGYESIPQRIGSLSLRRVYLPFLGAVQEALLTVCEQACMAYTGALEEF